MKGLTQIKTVNNRMKICVFIWNCGFTRNLNKTIIGIIASRHVIGMKHTIIDKNIIGISCLTAFQQ